MDRGTNIDGIRQKKSDKISEPRPITASSVSQKLPAQTDQPRKSAAVYMPKTIIAGLVVTIILTASGVWWWSQSHQPVSLLPATISEQVPFVTYFFNGSIPNGYSFTPDGVVYSQGLLSVALSKPGSQTITVSQQALPSSLKQSDLLSSNQKVSTPIGQATINDVDGRYLGSIVTNDVSPTLILVSSVDTGNQNDIIALMKALAKTR